MKNLFRLFILFLLFLSCSSEESKITDNIIMQNDCLEIKLDKQFVEIVLDDTAYLFVSSEIEDFSYGENKVLETNKCVFNEINLKTAGQSSIIFNDTVFLFDAGGATTATSLKSGESVSFELESFIFHPHCNVANYYNFEGKHYVYLSEWDGKHRCFVEELWFDNLNNKWNSKLRQILSLDIDDAIRGIGNMDWIVDGDNKMLYVQTYKDGTSENATSLIFLQFQLPPITEDKDIVLNVNQIIRRKEYPMIFITQDKFIYKNKMYIASGWGGYFPGKVTIIDLRNFVEVESYDLSAKNEEPEGIDMYKDNLLVFYWKKNYSIQNKESLYINFKNGMCLSYPISKIRKIQEY